MDNRPIGFFDSGLGGLTCIPYLQKALPAENIIYFGDTARTPYGSKTAKTITNFACQIADFLVEQDVKMIVIACNTVSATCLKELRRRHPQIPIVGIIEPAAWRTAETCAPLDRIGVIATKATINSHAYKQSVAVKNEALTIWEQACPAIVPLVEEGIIDNEIMDLTLKLYLDDFVAQNDLNTLLLGCTHYPLVLKNIRRLYPNLQIINPSAIVIDRVKEILTVEDMLAADDPQGNGGTKNHFYASDLSDNFLVMIDRIFEGESQKAEFVNLDI